MYKDTDISKALSHALRHEPWLYELELDDEGWVTVEAILTALRDERDEWRQLSRADLERAIASGTKRRHELSGDRIRALYGHSVPAKLRRTPAAPPSVLLHSTSPEAAELIAEGGLRPMSRQYVHLAIDVDTALEVGRRKSRSPVLFEIDAAAAHSAGIHFYEGNEKVWLADLIPAAYLRLVARP